MRFLTCLALLAALPASARNDAFNDRHGEHGEYATYLIEHEVGKEVYDITRPGTRSPHGAVLQIVSTLSDRGTARNSRTLLAMGPEFSPIALEQHRDKQADDERWAIEIDGREVTAQEGTVTRTIAKAPKLAFPGLASMPASLQMMMMRYWLTHSRPARLTILRASDKARPAVIRKVGEDQIGNETLTRYTIDNLQFGREIVWMDSKRRLAALMTFAGGLPIEQILRDYQPAFDQLMASGIRQEMADLDELAGKVKTEADGKYAIVGGRLIDGTGAAPIASATVIIENGRITAIGPSDKVTLPNNIKIIHAEGQSLLPGLWEMHSHFSGVEFGPALLSAGITTARDCGGEFEFLTAMRDKLAHGGLGPRLLLAGLIDSGGPRGFGKVDAETAEQGIAAVDRYADAGFQQIKVYTQLKPDVLKAIGDEAHKRGLSVTGHVPAAVDAFEGVAAGMDQINHLQFVTRAMRPVGDTSNGDVDLSSERAQALLKLLAEKQIVVDPTAGWGEMASHPKGVAAVSFEPGIAAAPFVLASKFEAMSGPLDPAHFVERMRANGRVIEALYKAGVPLVAGSDTNLQGYGLYRELEIYVEAGLPPLAALHTATLGAAKAMGLDKDSGSIEPGRRADLVLVAGDPSVHISDIRRVEKVVRDGRIYNAKALAATVGFNRESAPAAAAPSFP